MQEVNRYISCWKKGEDEKLIEEYALEESIKLDELKMLFEDSKNDPYLYYCYDIEDKHIEFFKDRANIDFDLTQYDYFLEATAEK